MRNNALYTFLTQNVTTIAYNKMHGTLVMHKFSTPTVGELFAMAKTAGSIEESGDGWTLVTSDANLLHSEIDKIVAHILQNIKVNSYPATDMHPKSIIVNSYRNSSNFDEFIYASCTPNEFETKVEHSIKSRLTSMVFANTDTLDESDYVKVKFEMIYMIPHVFTDSESEGTSEGSSECEGSSEGTSESEYECEPDSPSGPYGVILLLFFSLLMTNVILRFHERNEA